MRHSLRRVFFSSVLLAGVLSHPRAQTGDSQKMLDKSFQTSVGAQKYLLFVPKGYSATGTKRYPLVVSLRGQGSTYIQATDNFEMAHPWIEDSVQAREPHFIMVPECTQTSWGGLAGSASGGVMASASKAVMEAIADLKKQYTLDTNRFILTGFSLGGSGTYHILELTPGFWAAAVPTSAGGDSSKTEAFSKTAIWHHQGSLDGTAGQRMSKGLDNHGYKVVRVLCNFTINNPNAWRTALTAAGGNAEAVAFKDAKAPVTLDSLKRAIDAGARYLYTELTGGNHEAGWMGAAHNPLLAKWAFSKVRAGAQPVSLAPRSGKSWNRNGTTLSFGSQPTLGDGAFSLTGRSLIGSRPAAGKPHGSQVLVLRQETPSR